MLGYDLIQSHAQLFFNLNAGRERLLALVDEADVPLHPRIEVSFKLVKCVRIDECERVFFGQVDPPKIKLVRKVHLNQISILRCQMKSK